MIVVVNNDRYTVERAIHGPEHYNDIAPWRWTKLPEVLGIADAVAVRVTTVGELADAIAATAQAQDRMVLIEA